MQLTFSTEQEALRRDARAWLSAHIPGRLPSLATAEGLEAHRAWERTLFRDGWSAVGFPAVYGGRGLGIIEFVVFEEEYVRARGPERVSGEGILGVGPLLLDHGSEAQRTRFLVPMASGEEIWCRAWSEPDAGQGLAAVRSHAANASGDGWVLNGRKRWVRGGTPADWCAAVFRTDPGAGRHRGLTHFLVALDTPGVTVRAIPHRGEGTAAAEILFADVEVPDGQVLGTVGDGWSLAASMLRCAAAPTLRTSLRCAEGADRLVRLHAACGGPPGSADAVTRVALSGEAAGLHAYSTATKVARGEDVELAVLAGNVAVLECEVAVHSTALDLLGPHAELLQSGRPGEWLEGYLAALAATQDPDSRRARRALAASGLALLADRRAGGPAIGGAGGGGEGTGGEGTGGEGMDFGFSAPQEAQRQRLHEVLDAERRAERLGASATTGRVAGTDLWGVVAGLGVSALVVPAAAGGLGGNDVDLVGLLEEAGWAGLSEPLLETAALAAPTLAALWPEPVAAAALRAVVEGDVAVAVGGVDVSGDGVTSPTLVSGDGSLRTPRVVGARHAGLFLLACRDAESGWQLHVVPPSSCTVEPAPALSKTRDLTTVHWPLASETLLAYGVAAEAVVSLLADRAAAGTAAVLIGLADRLLALTSSGDDGHVSSEETFDPLAHGAGLAEAVVAVELARSATCRAAWSLATAQPTLSRDASMAKALASDAAELAARAARQVLAPEATTRENDLDAFAELTWALARAWGDAAAHRRLVLPR